MNKFNVFKGLIVTSLFVFVSGCVSNNTQYHWGEYETLIYKQHINPEEVSAVIQIKQLESDIEKAIAINKPVPPGVYAHLGMMYAINGNKELALSALNKEKELYPEATVFIDGLIQRSISKEEG